MIDETQEELASLYAFDLLEGAEKDAFEALLRSNSELREHVGKLRDSAASLAYVAPSASPPEALKERILHSAAQSRRPAPAAPVAKVVRFPSFLPWAIAACFALAAVWMGRLYRQSGVENARLRDQQILVQAALERTQVQLAATGQELKSREDLARFKISTLASMLGNTPQALAVAVWDPSRQEGVLQVSKLPAAAKGKDYQLWVIDPQYAAPVSAGIFTVNRTTGAAQVIFKADKPVKSAAKFAISLEQKGGEPEPAGPIVLLSQ